jgi:lambda repressor-like predicted transcriptional regulator
MKLSKAIRLAEENEACGKELDKLRGLLKSGVTKVEELVNHKDAPFWAYWFALEVIKGPWPKGEDVISKSAHWSYDYARDVIKGPWPEGEDAISQDAGWSHCYAKYVIKGPWPKGEDVISKDVHWSSRYNDYIKGRV